MAELHGTTMSGKGATAIMTKASAVSVATSSVCAASTPISDICSAPVILPAMAILEPRATASDRSARTSSHVTGSSDEPAKENLPKRGDRSLPLDKRRASTSKTLNDAGSVGVACSAKTEAEKRANYDDESDVIEILDSPGDPGNVEGSSDVADEALVDQGPFLDELSGFMMNPDGMMIVGDKADPVADNEGNEDDEPPSHAYDSGSATLEEDERDEEVRVYLDDSSGLLVTPGAQETPQSGNGSAGEEQPEEDKSQEQERTDAGVCCLSDPPDAPVDQASSGQQVAHPSKGDQPDVGTSSVKASEEDKGQEQARTDPGSSSVKTSDGPVAEAVREGTNGADSALSLPVKSGAAAVVTKDDIADKSKADAVLSEPVGVVSDIGDGDAVKSETELPSEAINANKTDGGSGVAEPSTTANAVERLDAIAEETPAVSEKCRTTSEESPVASEETRPVSEETRPVSEETSLLSEETRPLSEETRPPSEETRSPSEETRSLSEETRPPSEETRLQSEETRLQSEETQLPSEETRPPSEETRPASEETRPASEETRPASEETRPPSEETRPLSEETRPLLEENEATPDGTRPKSEEGLLKQAAVVEESSRVEKYIVVTYQPPDSVTGEAGQCSELAGSSSITEQILAESTQGKELDLLDPDKHPINTVLDVKGHSQAAPTVDTPSAPVLCSGHAAVLTKLAPGNETKQPGDSMDFTLEDLDSFLNFLEE